MVRVTFFCALAGIALIAGAATTSAAQRVLSVQETLEQLERDWNEAFYNKDVTFIESLLADDFIATYEDGSRGDKAKELTLTKEFNQAVESAVQDDFTIKIYGDTAVVWFTLNLVGIKQGERAELALSYTDVWVLRG